MRNLQAEGEDKSMSSSDFSKFDILLVVGVLFVIVVLLWPSFSTKEEIDPFAQDRGQKLDFNVREKGYLRGIQIVNVAPDDDVEEIAIHVDENWDCYFQVGEKCVIGKEEIK